MTATNIVTPFFLSDRVQPLPAAAFIRGIIGMMTIRVFFIVSFLFVMSTVFGGEDSAQTRKAVLSVTPFLVRIDTIGGYEKVGEDFANEGASTGFLLDREGYIITGAFHFLHDPSAILLQLSDGSKKAARKIATDRNRMLTLLKIENPDSAFLGKTFETLPNIRTKDSMQIGERCITVGVALSRAEPNIALGILSGKDRIWGKAIQTDAAVGPNNYGGPLIDRDGKLLGILVPLDMMSGELTAGAEMYDAGVGMAVPFEDIQNSIFPKLKKGKDLEPGSIGIHFKENRIFIGESIVDDVKPDSPAAAAGIKPGDKITAIDDKPMTTALQCTMNFRIRYAEETLKLRLLRQEKEQDVSVTLSGVK